jgi:hypothetical protein
MHIFKGTAHLKRVYLHPDAVVLLFTGEQVGPHPLVVGQQLVQLKSVKQSIIMKMNIYLKFSVYFQQTRKIYP